MPAVFIASGENYPDGLVSGSAAAVSGAPVLLTRKDSLPTETIAELVRLHPDKIYVAGGTAAISDAVVTQLQAYAPVVTRLYGSNRYATAVAISEAIFPTTIGGIPGPEGPAGPAGADSTVPGPKGDKVTGGGYLVWETGVKFEVKGNSPVAAALWTVEGKPSKTTNVAIYTLCADVALPVHTTP